MLLPWLLLSIFGSLFLDEFGRVHFRNKIGKTLGLGSLCYEQDGKEFLEACKDGHAPLVELMLKLSDSSVLNQTDDQENCEKTGLHWACENDRLEVVKLLVKDPNININVKDREGKTGLYLACEYLDTKFERQVQKAMAQRSTGSCIRCTNAFLVNERLELIKLLVEHPNINMNITVYRTIGVLGCCIHNEQVARVLLEKGKLEIQQMRDVKNFAKNEEDGSIQFEILAYADSPQDSTYCIWYLIQMNSPTSLKSIIRIGNQ